MGTAAQNKPVRKPDIDWIVIRIHLLMYETLSEPVISPDKQHLEDLGESLSLVEPLCIA